MSKGKVVAVNRRARFDYAISETLEAGIILQGTEVKSMRTGGVSITESFAIAKGSDIILLNVHIPPYGPANRFNHDPKRQRVLLLNRKEISRLMGLIKQERVTLVPLSLYFNNRGIAKVELGVAKGKKNIDKRETIKQRDWQRDKHRLLKETNRA